MFLIAVGIVVKKHILETLIHERENQQYNTQNNKGHNLAHGWHLPQVVDDEFANYIICPTPAKASESESPALKSSTPHCTSSNRATSTVAIVTMILRKTTTPVLL